MKLPEYVTAAEVRRVCKELGFRDWSKITKPTVSKTEASKILKIVNTKKMRIPLEDFMEGLAVELEHGTMYKEANVTNNHPILTGKIVLAHLNETMDYYKRLDVAEIEGDLMKAVITKNLGKIEAKYKKLIKAQQALSKAISAQLK
ncbi:MAG: DUF5661 family protein [Nitrospirota bacterium]